MTAIRLRQLTLDDVLPLVRISNRSFYEHARFPEQGAISAGRIRDTPDWQWGAFERGRLLGFLLTEPKREKSRVSIRLLATDPAAQGKGVARRLIGTLERKARREGYDTLSVGSPFAQGFYEKCGFACKSILLRMIKDILQRPAELGRGLTLHLLDYAGASAVLSSLPSDDCRYAFLTAFLRLYRHDRGLLIRVCRRGKVKGVVLGKVSDVNRDFVEVQFYHGFDNAWDAVFQAFEYNVSTLGLRYVGYTVAPGQEELFRALGYERSDRDFFWTMATLEKCLG